MQDVRTRIVVVVSKRRQVSAVSLWAYYFICKRQKCCLPDDFFFYLDFLKAMSNRHIYRILRVEAEVRLDQSCRTPNDNTHTHTHTHTEKGSKVSSSSSLFHPLACDSSSLRFVSFFLLATWSCVFFFLFFAVPFFVFDLRLLLASGTAIFLAEAHREGKVSRREVKSIRLMLSGWSIGASIRLPTNILESNGSAPDLSHWIFFPGFSLTLYIYQLDLP